MPITTDSLNKKLYQLLKVQGFDPVPKNSKGETTPVPDDADVFRFTYKVNGKEVGPAWITVDSSQELKIYYDDKLMNSGEMDSNPNTTDSFTDFLKQLKQWAQRRQLGFDIQNQDHLESDMAQREHMKNKERINEGYYPMGKTASYNDSVPSVKIILQHTRSIQEGEQRFRNIAKIFLENEVGERILAPTNRPGVAKIYARHLAEGGRPHDERWNHINGLVEEYTKMAGFVRATRNGQFNESAQQLVNEGIQHYQSLRESLSKMTGHRGYNAYFESWSPALMEDDTDADALNELFVQETMDPRIESVMPILSRIHKKVNEMSEVKALEEWADSLVSEATDEYSIPEGMLNNPGERDTPVADAILRRILTQRVDLLAKHGPEKVGDAIADVAEFVGDVDEIGSSDVSAWVSQVERNLGEEQLEESHMSEVDMIIHDIIDGELDAYDVMNNPKTPEEEYVAKILLDQYESVARDHRLHPDDDFEQILDIVVDNLAQDYKHEEVEEGLDANQKRVGQLGPTEKVKNNNIGKLVGANESVELSEMDKSEDNKGPEGKATPIKADKAKKDFAKMFQKNIDKANKAKQDTDKKVAQHQIKEGQEDLDAILRIIKK